MAISLIDNLKIQNKKQNVERDSFATILDMVSYSPNYLPNIFHAMCEETGKMYVYNVNNDEDETLGKWREFSGGSGGGTADVPIEKIKVNGELQTPVNKVVDITVPSIEGLTKDADLATVAKSGSYEDLINKPTIPDAYDDTALSNRVKSVEDEIPNLATKTYVGEQITNAEHLKREIVTVLPSDTEASDNIIYMLKVESATGNDKYQEYMKIDGTVQMVGDTSVDLTDYAKSVDIPTTVAELTDSADYAKTTDIPTTLPANGGNADTVNNHTVKSDVPENAVFTDTVYDDTEVNTKLNAKVGKTDIATIIDGTSTDTQVPSAKAVWNKSKNNIQTFSGIDIIAYADSISNEMVTDTVRIMNATNSPYGVNQTNNDFHYTIYNITDDEFKRILAYDIRKNDMYMIMKKDGMWGTWQRVCTTKVANVPFTKLTLDSSVFTLVNSDAALGYSVCNGMCIIACSGIGLVSVGSYIVTTNIPKPAGGYASNILQPGAGSSVPTTPVFLVASNNTLTILSSTHTGAFWGTLTYPVAES